MKKQLAVACLFLSHLLLAQDLSVMTYNIRLDWGTDENRWDNRRELLVNQLKFYDADLIGVQEALPHQMDFLDSALSTYDYLGVGRDDGKRQGEFSAIFYRKDQFKVLKSGTFWLSTTPEKPSKGWDAAIPRICTYGYFESSGTGERFWLFNTHFDHVGKEARLNSMTLILSQIAALTGEKDPVILMGDLNAEPESEPIETLFETLQDARALARVKHGPEATFNGFQFDQVPERRIDYIAMNDRFLSNKYAVLTDSYMGRYISDHFAVLCTLSIKE